jgi:TonB family protein
MRKASQIMSTWASVVASVALHLTALLLVFVAPSLFQARTATWGSRTGGHDGVNIKIVSNISGLELPTPVVTADDAVPSENKSLHKNEPEPKVKAPDKPDPAAVKLPSKTAPKDTKETKQPAPPVKTASADVPQPQNPPNAVPYGQGGGNPSLRYGQTAPGTGPTGAEFAGDGTFGEKYSFYVEAMKRAITNAWQGGGTLQRTPRIYVTFTIDSKGQVSNVAVQDPSPGAAAMERAAMQAVKTAKLPPLPPDYRGPPVAVRFYFDYAK